MFVSIIVFVNLVLNQILFWESINRYYFFISFLNPFIFVNNDFMIHYHFLQIIYFSWINHPCLSIKIIYMCEIKNSRKINKNTRVFRQLLLNSLKALESFLFAAVLSAKFSIISTTSETLLMAIYVYCHQKNSLNIQKILYMTMLTLKLTKQIMLNFLQKMYMLSGTISRSETPKLCSVQTFLTECITKSHIMSTEMKYISTRIRSG